MVARKIEDWEGTVAGDAGTVRGAHVSRGARRHPRRAPGLCAVLQAGLLRVAPARDLRRLAGRDVVSRRPARRHSRHGMGGAPSPRGRSAADGLHRAARAARHRRRAVRQFHQRRALRPGNGVALGNGVPRRTRRRAIPRSSTSSRSRDCFFSSSFGLIRRSRGHGAQCQRCFSRATGCSVS